MQEKEKKPKSKEELVEWVTTLTRKFVFNGWKGNFQPNVGEGGYIGNMNVTVCLKPGQTIEIKG